jgi:hypothetical protein
MQAERVLHFPHDRTLGRIVIVEPGKLALPGDPFVLRLEAQGDIVVPPRQEVQLHLRFPDWRNVNLLPLSLLQPDALDHLSIDSCHLPDAELRYLGHLVGLSRLYLRDTGTSDNGLVHIGRLSGLQVLGLDHVSVSDGGLTHLRGLTRLRSLELMKTTVTSAGVKWLRETLLGCTVRF